METSNQRAKRILKELKAKYPDAAVWDVDGSKNHFVAEIEPSKDHPEYDRAIEVVIKSKPHKHFKSIQRYKVLLGTLSLHLDHRVKKLNTGDEYTVLPGVVHWAESDDECWVEIYSTPGWTKEDHIEIGE